ncbi:MutS-related protein [Massilia glaciei]|uniref:DNA mismatch repair protein MutS n=1 Tax=Massilia glaciei TaxID=1524097 RepID=A0A2U2I6P8_9BURK|nr:hypothetical protein [Massilia glaciei]PWF55410.1 hypothetical protein C7C56_002050 [Massilia glaciei]
MPLSFASVTAPVKASLQELRTLLLPDPEPLDYPFAPDDVAQLHRLHADPGAAALDDTTWKDLLLGPYLAQLSPELSIFGQQMLHHRLRAGMDDGGRDALGERVREHMRDPVRLRQLRSACHALRAVDTEVAGLLFADDAPPARSAWAGKCWLLLAALLVSLGAVLLTPFAYLGAGLALFTLMSMQVRYGPRIEAWNRKLKSLQLMLRVDSELGTRDEAPLAGFVPAAAQSGRLNHSLSRSWVGGVTPGARAYSDWFMLANLEHYWKCVALVHGQRDFLRAAFLRCAGLEADLALARHLLQTPSACWADRGGAAELALDGAVHPLMAQAQPLTFRLHGKGAFISGRNGIGKSTLLRTIGLNLVAARAFGFCYAAGARVPQLPVYASMQSEDSLFGGESLYMAELRRARELLAAADGPHPGVYLIDEIFRGTNHLESVSAAAAVLDALAAKGMVIVSSHNLVLAPLLAHRLAPWCVAADAHAMLTLAPGVLSQTNGIALLGARGLGQELEANAGRVYDWLSGYLARPADCSHVLGGAGASDEAAGIVD